jgi:hypothetical protein
MIAGSGRNEFTELIALDQQLCKFPALRCALLLIGIEV